MSDMTGSTSGAGTAFPSAFNHGSIVELLNRYGSM